MLHSKPHFSVLLVTRRPTPVTPVDSVTRHLLNETRCNPVVNVFVDRDTRAIFANPPHWGAKKASWVCVIMTDNVLTVPVNVPRGNETANRIKFEVMFAKCCQTALTLNSRGSIALSGERVRMWDVTMVAFAA